jgi:hypothetical protein
LRIRDKILEKYDGPDDQVLSKNKITPKSLINFLECYCWANGNYEAECLVISNVDYDYAIYEISNGFMSGKKRGNRVVAFRYSEFQSIQNSLKGFSFRLLDVNRGFNGRLDSRWKSIFLG